MFDGRIELNIFPAEFSSKIVKISTRILVKEIKTIYGDF